MCATCDAFGFADCSRCGNPAFQEQQFVSRRLGMPGVMCAYCLEDLVDEAELDNAYVDAGRAGHRVP